MGADKGSPERLLAIATEKVQDGSLPRESSAKLLAGPGRDGRCSLCEDIIPATETEYEVTVHAGAVRTCFFHIRCYHAWTRACPEVS